MATSEEHEVESNWISRSENLTSYYLKDLLHGLSKLRIAEKGCDLILYCNEAVFKCHRVVMASSCDYFYSLFFGGLHEIGSNSNGPYEVIIENFKEDYMKMVIDFIYCASLPPDLTYEELTELYEVALYLQVRGLLEIIGERLAGYVSHTNCISLLQLGMTSSHKEKSILSESALYCLRINFQSLGATEQFKRDITAKQLHVLLTNDLGLLQVENELMVFNIVMDWVSYNTEERKHDLPMVLKSIRYFQLMIPLMAEGYDDVLNYVTNIDYIKAEESLVAIVTETFHEQEDEYKMKSHRKPSDLLIVVQYNEEGHIEYNGYDTWNEELLETGIPCYSQPPNAKWHIGLNFFWQDTLYHIDRAQGKVSCCNICFIDSKRKWEVIDKGSMLAPYLYDDTILFVSNDQLVLIYTERDTSRQESFAVIIDLPSFLIIDGPIFLTEEPPQSHFPYKTYAYTVIGDKIFIAGETFINGFDIKTRITEEISICPQTIPKACRLISLGNKLVFIGGKSSRSVFAFDIAKQSWNFTMPRLSQERQFPSAAIVNDDLYVIGGTSTTKPDFLESFNFSIKDRMESKDNIELINSLPRDYRIAILSFPHWLKTKCHHSVTAHSYNTHSFAVE